MGLYGEERRASSGDVGRKDRGAQEEGGTEESLGFHSCCCFVVSQAKGKNNRSTDGCLEEPPGAPCSVPCTACSFPVPQILPSSCTFPFSSSSAPQGQLWNESATSDSKEWLRIPSCHHHFQDPWQRAVTVVAAGYVLPWRKRELIYSLKLGANMCFGRPLEVALPETLLP